MRIFGHSIFEYTGASIGMAAGSYLALYCTAKGVAFTALNYLQCSDPEKDVRLKGFTHQVVPGIWDVVDNGNKWNVVTQIILGICPTHELKPDYRLGQLGLAVLGSALAGGTVGFSIGGRLGQLMGRGVVRISSAISSEEFWHSIGPNIGDEL